MEATIRPLETCLAQQQTNSVDNVQLSKDFAIAPAKTMDELLQSQAPALCMVNKRKLVMDIALCIGDYLSFIGCASCMSEQHIMETAQMMIDTHPHLPIDAIKTFFYNCKRGVYGSHYNKMDGSKLLQWYDKFVNDYYVQLEEQAYQRHMQAKEGLSAPVTIKDGDRELTSEELADAYSILLNGKTVAEKEKADRIAAIRLKVIEDNMSVYSILSAEEAENYINNLINEQLKKENLL